MCVSEYDTFGPVTFQRSRRAAQLNNVIPGFKLEVSELAGTASSEWVLYEMGDTLCISAMVDFNQWS